MSKNERLKLYIDCYQELRKQRPDLFEGRKNMILDPDKMLTFASIENKDVGVIYVSPWHYLIVDLLETDDKQKRYTYERFVSRSQNTGAVVLPYTEDGKVLLLSHYRHNIGRVVFEFPRGFADANEGSFDTALRELFEETTFTAVSYEKIGSVIADSGVSGDEVAVIVAKVEDGSANVGHEGIEGFRLITLEQMDKAIAQGIISDGFSLSAIALWKAWRDRNQE